MKNLILILFFITYFGIVFKRDKANIFVYGCVFLFIILKAINFQDIFYSINYNVLGIFLGTSILSFLFTNSKIPAYIVSKIEQKNLSVGMIYLLICIITSFISSFIENVATILIMAPVAFEFTKKNNLNPIPLFVGMAVSSNLQGCATMIGDSPSIILAMESNMNFLDFFYMPGKKLGLSNGRPGLFFFVQFGAIFSYFVLYLFFRKEKGKIKFKNEEYKIKTYIPTFSIILMIITLAITSFFQDKFSFFPACVCLFYGLTTLFIYLKKFKDEKISIKHIDWDSFFLLIGIFILVGTLKKYGFIEMIADFLLKIGGKNPFILFNLIVWISVFISAFVDNIPYTMAMISGIQILCTKLSLNPYLFLFGLLLGTCVGGNITPIAASCNVVGVGILKKNGYKVKFSDFVKIGLPFTIIAVFGSTLLLYFVYI